MRTIHKLSANPLGAGLLAGLILTLLISGSIWLWPLPETPTTSVAAEAGVPAAAPTPVTEPGPAPRREPPADRAEGPSITPKNWGAEAFAPSLAGTEIDGRLRADTEGNLVVELEVKDFFDYFLSTVGEVTPEEASAQIQALAEKHLPPRAVQQAQGLLENYLAFKQRVFEYSQQPLIPVEQQTPAYQLQQLQEAQAALKRIRRETLSPEAVEAFFGLEEAYGDFTLASIRIQQRDDLSDRQKQEMIDYERSRLPPVLRGSHRRITESASRAAGVEAVISSAPSPQAARTELQAMGLPEKHVEEIVTVLQRQDDFERQYQNYRKERQELAEAGLSPADREKAEATLRSRYFEGEQQKTWARLRDLDDASDSPAGDS